MDRPSCVLTRLCPQPHLAELSRRAYLQTPTNTSPVAGFLRALAITTVGHSAWTLHVVVALPCHVMCVHLDM